jgi:hypothetical protein
MNGILVSHSITEEHWLNELRSLGISPDTNNEFNREELKDFVEIIKRSMYEDYKLAYSEKGEEHKVEAESTITA